MEAGEFDDLPGAGKPIPDLDRPYDPEWWARKLIERERLRDIGLNPRGNAERKKNVAYSTVRTRSSDARKSEG